MRTLMIVVVLFLFTGTLFAEVSESTWKALLNSNVTIVKLDGSEVRGRLTLIEAASVSVIKANGEVVTILKKDVREARGRISMQDSADPGRPSPGWAMGAGVYGYIAAGVVVLVGIATIATNDGYSDAPIFLGGTDLLLAALSFPIVAFGDASAIRGMVTGSLALQITGYATWGLTLALGIAEVIVGVNTMLPNGLILSTVLLGASALVCMATDAVLNAGAAEVALKSTTRTLKDGPAIAILPLFGFTEKADLQVGLRCQVWL